ncbi:hypothetical protein K491DRAFT_571619, partial [Lophiostoma macrostomum CBS 122681]
VPYCSSIPTAYESHFWRASIDASWKFIELLAKDESVADIPIRGDVTLRTIASHELRPGFEQRSARATAYMYPFCGEQRRLEIIAVLMTMLFLFDGKFARICSENCADLFPSPTTSSNSPLQSYLNAVITDIHASDRRAGNGGAEVHAEMRKTFSYLRPEATLTSVEEYLRFRRQNVCAGFVFASIKFSIASSVDMHQPHLVQIMTWAADHLSIVNDLYSYAKEARAFNDKSCPDLINVVSVLQRVTDAPDDESALQMAFALLLQREEWMFEKLTNLRSTGALDEETWTFLRAVWACLSGNVMYSMTCERYGGEAARI